MPKCGCVDGDAVRDESIEALLRLLCRLSMPAAVSWLLLALLPCLDMNAASDSKGVAAHSRCRVLLLLAAAPTFCCCLLAAAFAAAFKAAVDTLALLPGFTVAVLLLSLLLSESMLRGAAPSLLLSPLAASRAGRSSGSTCLNSSLLWAKKHT